MSDPAEGMAIPAVKSRSGASTTKAYSPLYISLAWLFLSVFHLRATHQFSPKAYFLILVICSSCLAYGKLCRRLTALYFAGVECLSIQLLIGFLVLNTIIFGMFAVTPLSLAADFWIVAVAGIGGAALFRCFLGPIGGLRPRLPDLLCLVISGASAILWCSDSWHSPDIDGHAMVYHTWMDGFIHVREISAIGQAHGLRALNDLRMSGAPAGAYHIASYMVPAIVSSTTGTTAFDAFTGVQLPVGILLTGLAAFSLVTSFWGVWPGLSATTGILLLPDAYEQGFGCKFLSYEFLQQVAPAGFYGVACAAAGWMFILNGCKLGKRASILVGWTLIALTLTYKAHLFVANALLAIMYPCIFLQGIRAGWRLVIASGLASLFLAAVHFSKNIEAVPTLRVDGNSAGKYSMLLLGSYDPGFWKSIFTSALIGQEHSRIVVWFYVSALILIATFGFWIPACAASLICLRNRTQVAAFWFPIFIGCNYIVMSVGLALDEKNVATREELLHRPFVWAYFAIVACTAGGSYAFFFGNRPPARLSAQVLGAVLVLGCLGVPIRFARNLQTMPVWPAFRSFKELNAIPSGLVGAARYIRDHSREGDLILDSENDPKLVVSALAERQDFAVEYVYSDNRAPNGLHERLNDLGAFRQKSDVASVIQYARENKISWYVLQPSSKLEWPRSILDAAVFESDGYRVFHFDM